MFVVRDAQIEAMLEPMRRRFVEGMRTWLRDKYARDLEKTSDDELCTGIRAGMERAMQYGIDTEASMSLFVELAVALGPDFDRREDAAWLKGFLENPRIPAQQKAEYVYRKLLRERPADRAGPLGDGAPCRRRQPDGLDQAGGPAR